MSETPVEQTQQTTTTAAPQEEAPAPPTWSARVDNLKGLLKQLRDLPYCTGITPLDPESSTLFFKTANGASFIDFTDPKDEDLSLLAAACQPASFGRGEEDVYDDSYRKAGKMDVTDFSILFNPWASGMLDTINQMLLRKRNAGNSNVSIKAQLYKLNVYGPGSFFKSHVDTPRGDYMFGSLVIVLPTKHEGGSLVFRHDGQECVFDTAAAASSEPTPHAAFVAFFSDIEHEVLEVKSGYRVTLTYNLYFAVPPKPPTNLGLVPSEGDPLLTLKSNISELLATPTFLPDGGYLAFRLAHKYPITPSSTVLHSVRKRLKGIDATLYETCKSLSLTPNLRLLYRYEKEVFLFRTAPISCLLDKYVDMTKFNPEDLEDLACFLLSDQDQARCRVTYAWDGKEKKWPEELRHIYNKAVPTVWIVPYKSALNTFEQKVETYGNEARVETVYHEVYLVVRLKPFATRFEVEGKNKEGEKVDDEDEKKKGEVLK
ncbi:hypothetical protein D9613_009835 [Agrocybe pediades]|uniref:Fe2OG dioxygenase domain-containing protein n=1 Tax=Agrocybe pediades TaxID=84607 RepID=A0A8H4QWT9_9AGAR|nr:hypothetical protein D9613_009835 [Agrocybe pediades]